MNLKKTNNELACIFCDKSKLAIVKEYKNSIIIRDLFPKKKNHFLLITKKHLDTNSELLKISILYIRILKELKEFILQYCLNKDYNIIINKGKSAGQEINHFHIHILYD